MLEKRLSLERKYHDIISFGIVVDVMDDSYLEIRIRTRSSHDLAVVWIFAFGISVLALWINHGEKGDNELFTGIFCGCDRSSMFELRNENLPSCARTRRKQRCSFFVFDRAVKIFGERIFQNNIVFALRV